MISTTYDNCRSRQSGRRLESTNLRHIYSKWNHGKCSLFSFKNGGTTQLQMSGRPCQAWHTWSGSGLAQALCSSPSGASVTALPGHRPQAALPGDSSGSRLAAPLAGQLLPRDVAVCPCRCAEPIANTAVDAPCLAELRAGARPQTGVSKALNHTGRIICYSIS